MANRGRKPGAAKSRNYFQQEQEAAVIEYISAATKHEKDRIYNEKLRVAFDKMVESIIRRYKLYIPDETFEETFTDTISFLMTKIDKFKPGKYKAYSYYGTICKNHLIGRIESRTKSLQKYVPYETSRADFVNSLRYSDYNSGNAKIASESVSMMIKRITDMVSDPDKYGLKDSEVKMGNSLRILLEDWDFVLSTDGSKKLNKQAVLFFLRESTGFDTKGVRDNMRKFKKEFYIIKEYLVN